MTCLNLEKYAIFHICGTSCGPSASAGLLVMGSTLGWQPGTSGIPSYHTPMFRILGRQLHDGRRIISCIESSVTSICKLALLTVAFDLTTTYI